MTNLAPGALLKHADHKNPVQIERVDGGKAAVMVFPIRGGIYRAWVDVRGFEGT